MGNVKAYKSFPVFIKNISGKKLILPINKSLGTFGINSSNKWQLIWNDNAFACGDSYFLHQYFILNPDEIIIYAVNFYNGQQKTKFRIGMSYDLYSKEFEGFINPKVFKNQRIIHELEENTK